MAERSTPHFVEQTGRHRVAAGRVPADSPIPDAPARPRNPRWLWLIPIGAMVVGAALGILPFLEEFGRPPDSAIPPPAPVTSRETTAQPGEPLETSAPATPLPTSRRAAAASAPARTSPLPSPSAGPVLLGPASNDALETMVQRYCDRHAGGLADPRQDGRWQCLRLLSGSIADLEVACRDTYGSAAHAQTTDPDDPYAWRCYR